MIFIFLIRNKRMIFNPIHYTGLIYLQYSECFFSQQDQSQTLSMYNVYIYLMYIQPI